jgi:hypothetical protein
MLRQEILEAKVIREDITYIDRLVTLDIQYGKTDRKMNLEYFGVTGAMQRRALKKMESWDKKSSKIDALLKEALDENRDLVEKAFCIKNPNERPRYYAAMFLISQNQENAFEVIDLKRVSKLEYQDWAEVVPFDVVYDKLELREDPKTNTTLMFAAALFAEKVISYLSLMHLFMESASNPSKRICISE